MWLRPGGGIDEASRPGGQEALVVRTTKSQKISPRVSHTLTPGPVETYSFKYNIVGDEKGSGNKINVNIV